MYTPWFSGKQPYLIVALGCFGLVIGAVAIQLFVKLIPCPLCVAQRLCFGAAGLSALTGYIFFSRRRWERTVPFLMFFFALLGGGIAARQVWLQHFPPASFDPTKCVVSFGSVLDGFLRALGGAGNCAVKDFALFGLQLSEWSLLCFIGLMSISLWLLLGLNQEKVRTE